MARPGCPLCNRVTRLERDGLSVRFSRRRSSLLQSNSSVFFFIDGQRLCGLHFDRMRLSAKLRLEGGRKAFVKVGERYRFAFQRLLRSARCVSQ